ncbi:MAG: Hsp20/alpha crystallin family protein [Pseudomonadota bacterium]
MADDKRRKIEETMADLDLRLDGLLGKLGGTLGEMLERLDSGETAEFRRDHEVQTARGPLRAETGIRVRMGGLEAGAAHPGARRRDGGSAASGRPGERDPAQPVNPGRDAAATTGDHGPNATRSATGDTPAMDPGAGATNDPSPDPAQTREAHLESYEAEGRWFLCADLPGVTLPEVDVSCADGSVTITTTGARRYRARHALPNAADLSDMVIVLRNGVLEIAFGLGDAL